MLRHSKEPKGLCINCAVHYWLRNTYPPNILIAQSGPKILLYTHIQKQFTENMRIGFSDAKPDEINWQMIVDNWELPFPHKVKSSPMNPYGQKELDEIKAGNRRCFGPPKNPTICGDKLGDNKMTITSFEELNEIKPGLGDELKRCLKRAENE